MKVRLWSPYAALAWSLVFSPIFGAWIHAKNWGELGDAKRARKSMRWVYGGFLLYGIQLLLPSGLGAVFAPLFFLAWYLFGARDQFAYVKSTLHDRYVRNSWSAPLGYGLAWLIGYGALAGVVASVSVGLSLWNEERNALEKAAIALVNQIIERNSEQLAAESQTPAKCLRVRIDGQIDAENYRATAILDNGTNADIIIRRTGDQIEVSLGQQPQESSQTVPSSTTLDDIFGPSVGPPEDGGSKGADVQVDEVRARSKVETDLNAFRLAKARVRLEGLLKARTEQYIGEVSIEEAMSFGQRVGSGKSESLPEPAGLEVGLARGVTCAKGLTISLVSIAAMDYVAYTVQTREAKDGIIEMFGNFGRNFETKAMESLERGDTERFLGWFGMNYATWYCLANDTEEEARLLGETRLNRQQLTEYIRGYTEIKRQCSEGFRRTHLKFIERASRLTASSL